MVTGRLERRSRSRGTEPRRWRGGIDDEDLVEGFRQVLGLAHEVDRLPDRPERRHGDELGLHAPPGAVFRVVEGALERDALDGGQLVEDLRLFVFAEGSRGW